MEAHEIIDRTMGKNEAEKLARAARRTPELFNSYRRPPRTPDNPFGTGNYSPLFHYREYFTLRLGFNREGAVQMHALLNAEVGGLLDGEVEGGESLASLSNELLRRAAEAVTALNDDELRHASTERLKSLDQTLNKLASQIEITRSVIRAEVRVREGMAESSKASRLAQCP